MLLNKTCFTVHQSASSRNLIRNSLFAYKNQCVETLITIRFLQNFPLKHTHFIHKIKLIYNQQIYITPLTINYEAVQQNEYKTIRYFSQNFQCKTMLIHTFCKIFEHQIVLQECKSKQTKFRVHNCYKTRE